MYKIGSLFSGSGGFELAGAMSGFEPVWASEIEAFPIAVTTKRFPQMKHLGDVRNINGAEIEPVDVITFGSPCQDFSIAGNRAGIEGKRSGLFTEAIRVITEMRYKTDGKYPRFAVFENVPGLFSSGKGEDFRTVLEEFAKVKEADISIPMPAKSKWHNAGNIVGDGWSVAWRVLNAQYFGVAQRRRRIYLVADFGGECAGDVLFEREGVQRHTETSGETGETSTADTEGGTGASGFNGWRSVTGSIEYSEEMSPCLNTKMPPTVIYDARGNGDGFTSNAITGDHNGHISDYTALAVHQNQEGEVRAGSVANTLNTNSNASGRNSPLVAHTYCVQGNTIDRSDSAGANGSGVKEDVSFTLNTVDRHAVVYSLDRASYNQGQNAQFDISIHEEQSQTLVAKGPHAVATVDCQNAVGANNYAVRRLMPTECARLQGFPDGWCSDIPHSDSAEYKMWGNGICLPVVIMVLSGIVVASNGGFEEKMIT